MAESLPVCKGCSATVHVTDGEIDDMIRSLALRPGEAAASASYRARLDACHSCNHFAHGTTCMQCGCLVRVRALLSGAKCPDPARNQWKTIT